MRRPPRKPRSSRPNTPLPSSESAHASSCSMRPAANAAPIIAPIEQPATTSGAIAFSINARMMPTCAQPRAEPLPSANPSFGRAVMGDTGAFARGYPFIFTRVTAGSQSSGDGFKGNSENPRRSHGYANCAGDHLSRGRPHGVARAPHPRAGQPARQVRCHVTLTRENGAHHKGNHYSVMVEVRVPPQHDLAIRKDKEIREMRTQLPAVINLAFGAIERQLKKTAELRR